MGSGRASCVEYECSWSPCLGQVNDKIFNVTAHVSMRLSLRCLYALHKIKKIVLQHWFQSVIEVQLKV